jgi:hypothetical protein
VGDVDNLFLNLNEGFILIEKQQRCHSSERRTKQSDKHVRKVENILQQSKRFRSLAQCLPLLLAPDGND